MRATTRGPDALAERRRLGHDRFDEMWEGVLHVVPAPNNEHQRTGTALVALWYPLAVESGLHLRYEVGLYDPAVPELTSYRQPDLALFGDDVSSERGIEGAAHLVVEICSPGDESREKLPFYERMGVTEVLFVDRDTKAIRRWVRRDGTLVELGPDGHGRHRLLALPVALATDAGTLVVETASGTTRI